MFPLQCFPTSTVEGNEQFVWLKDLDNIEVHKKEVFFSLQVEQSLLVTGFGYEHDDPWATNMELFKEFTDISRVYVLLLQLLFLVVAAASLFFNLSIHCII